MAKIKFQHTGVPCQLAKGATSLFSLTLQNIAHKIQPDKSHAKEKKRRTGWRGIKMSDAEIANARQAYEAGEMTCAELAKLYSVNRYYMHHVLAYEVRSNYHVR